VTILFLRSFYHHDIGLNREFCDYFAKGNGLFSGKREIDDHEAGDADGLGADKTVPEACGRKVFIFPHSLQNALCS
jgi:hypothetical protein